MSATPDGAPSATARRRARRRRRGAARLARPLLTLLFLGLAVHILLPQLATLRASADTLRALRLPALAVAVAAQAVSYLGSGFMLRSIAALAGARLPLVRGAGINLAAQSVGVLGTGNLGYGAALYRWMLRSRVPPAGAMLAGWLPVALVTSVQAIFALAGVVVLLAVGRLSRAMAAAFALVVVVLVGVIGGVLWSARDRQRFTANLMRIAYRWARVRRRPHDRAEARSRANRLFAALQRLRAGGWRGPAAGALIYVAFDLLTLASLFAATGHRVSPGTVLAGYGLPLVLGKLTVLPGGVGIVEGAMAALYDGLGIPSGVAVVAVLGYRVVSFWTPLLLGIPLALLLGGPPPAPPRGREEGS